MKSKKEKLGLVLAGGGGKGAYQIGVWKYLHEIGLDSHFDVVSGTSVGALNAVLFSLGDVKKAERIWTECIEKSILFGHQEEEIQIPGNVINFTDIIFGILANGLFSRDGLKEIIEKETDLNILKKNKMHVYATCTRVQDFAGVPFLLNDWSKRTIVQILLASSAIPGVFKPEIIRDKAYYDGGVIPENNIPLTPLNDEKCSFAVVVALNDILELNSSYNMIVIRPSQNLGDIFEGTLNFSSEKALELIQLGYSDASTIYAEQLHELAVKMCVAFETVTMKDVISCFKVSEIMALLSEDKNILPVLIKEKSRKTIKLSACLFDNASNKVRDILKIWNVSELNSELSEMFGDKQLVVLQ